MINITRHAQSTVNAGQRVENPLMAGLSELGREQASGLADKYESPPDLIIVSDAPRTQLTALPLLEKFPNVPVKTMPVYEFYFICNYRIRSTTAEERKKMLDEYFAREDPNYIDGGNCESFDNFILRVKEVLGSLDHNKNILIISHGHFINGVKMVMESLPLTVRQFAEMQYVEHTELIEIKRQVQKDIPGWRMQKMR